MDDSRHVGGDDPGPHTATAADASVPTGARARGDPPDSRAAHLLERSLLLDVRRIGRRQGRGRREDLQHDAPRQQPAERRLPPHRLAARQHPDHRLLPVFYHIRLRSDADHGAREAQGPPEAAREHVEGVLGGFHRRQRAPSELPLRVSVASLPAPTQNGVRRF